MNGTIGNALGTALILIVGAFGVYLAVVVAADVLGDIADRWRTWKENHGGR